MKLFPTLYKITSTGAVQEWDIFVDGSSIVAVWGQRDGAKQTTRDFIAKGKNLGKANETSPEQQAGLEAEARWTKKLKSGYVQTLETAHAGEVDALIEGGVSPMLAHVWEKHPKRQIFPAMVQPKLDGHRCVAVVREGKCTLWSRTRKPITSVPHIVAAIEALVREEGTENVTLDGELYAHDYREKFEELTSYIRQETPKPGHEVVQYHVYDLVSQGLPFRTRYEVLQNMAFSGPLRLVETVPVSCESDLQTQMQAWLEAGYEGLMYRRLESEYEHKRSYSLLKVKTMQDAEFPITGVEEGRGKLAGCAIFVCGTPEGKQFSVKLRGSEKALKDYWAQPATVVGKQLTVKFQDYTADRIPRFPVGMRIREEV